MSEREKSHEHEEPQVAKPVEEGAHAGPAPLKPEVVAAIRHAAEHLTPHALHGKKVHGILLGTYLQAGDVTLPHAVDPKGLPASVFVCMNVPLGSPQKVDGNHATHFYVQIGHDIYGTLPFANPLVHA